MLDTNIISALIRYPNGRAAQRLAEVGEDSVCTSIIVAAELRYGGAKKGSSNLLKKIDAVLDEMRILPLDVPVDAHYGGLRVELEAAGLVIGHNDLLIAAHSRAIGAVLVTANLGEFSRVRGLIVENWIA